MTSDSVFGMALSYMFFLLLIALKVLRLYGALIILVCSSNKNNNGDHNNNCPNILIMNSSSDIALQ